MGGDGRLIVAEVGQRRVIAIDRESGAVEVLAGDLPLGLPAAAGTPPPGSHTGIAVGQDGAIYVSSDLENAILRLTER